MDNQSDERLRSRLKSDISEQSLSKNFMRDLKDLKEFYISNEKKKQLSKMNPFKRFFFLTFWILKSMILKLTPVRRLLLLFGIIMLFISGGVFRVGDDIQISFNRALIGGIIIVFILMLELKDKLLAHNELEAGRKIQKALMPEQSPYIEGWTVWLYSQSANEVCGDLVDYIKSNDERFGLYIADVAGKGLNAALLTTKLQAIIRSLSYDYKSVELIKKVNKIFYKESLRNIFASLLFLEIQKDYTKLNVVNSGHFPPLILRKNNFIEIPKGGIALGVMPDAEYPLQEIEIEKGDLIICYSDGVVEAKKESGEFFGIDKFKNTILSNATLSVKDIGENIFKSVELFTKDDRLSDDLSLIILRKE